MSLSPTLILELLVLGAFVGFLAGLLGVGGGLLQVPIMTLVLDRLAVPGPLVVKVAIATSLATILFTSASSVRAHHQRGAVRWDLVRGLTPGIVLGSLAGAAIARFLPSAFLALGFSAIAAISATQMWRRQPPPLANLATTRRGLLGAGAAVGGLSALVGAGGAFVSVPYLTRRRVDVHHAVATSGALGFPIALAGSVGYVVSGLGLQGLPPGMLGFIYLPALACIASASVLLAPLGARVSHGMDIATLRRSFAVLLYVLACAMLAKGLTV